MKDILHELQIILDASEDFYWTVDRYLRLRFCNAAFTQMLEQLSGQRLRPGDEVLTPAYGPTTYTKWKDYYTRALGGEYLCMKEEFVHPLTGKLNRHVITIKPVENKEKEVVGLVCSSKNITAIKKEQDNQGPESVYIDLLNESTDVICFINAAGNFGFVNKAAEKIWGYAAGEITGRNQLTMLYENDRLKTVEAVAAVMDGVELMDFENRYLHKDGRLVPMLWSARWEEKRQLMYWVGRDAIKQSYGSRQDINQAKQTEVQLREVLDSISDAFYAVDENWHFTYFNKQAERLLKRSSTELIGKNIWTSFPAAKGTELEHIYRQVARTGKSKSFEYYFPADRSWYEVNACASNGGVSAYFKNIDERKQSAAALQKAYDEKTNILESIGDAFFTMDRNFVVSYWNKVAEELIGIKREQVVGKNLWEVFPDAVHLASYRNYHRVLETGEAMMFEDNYGIWLEVNAFPSEEGLTVFFRDITQRKEADLRLREAYRVIEESQKRYRDLFRLSPIPMWVYDLDSLEFLDVNEAAVRHYGYSREEFMQMSIYDIRAVEDWPQLDQALVKARHNDFTYKSGIFRHLKKNGELMMVKVESDKIEYKGRRGVVVLVNDLTELLQTQESLKNAYENMVEIEEQEREKFVAEIHDGVAQNLVAMQMIFNHLLQSYPGLAKQFQSSVLKETMEKAVAECQDIVNNVRPKELIDNGLTAMIRQLIKKVTAAGKIKVSFEQEGSLDQHFTYNELFHIYRIIQENLNNTLKYAKATEVELRFELEKDQAIIFFSDNGVGVSDEIINKPSSFLSIKKRIKVLQGEFFVYNNQPGGTKFKYHIPINQKTGS